MPPEPGMSATRTFVVGPQDTARAVGSGALDVLGTPRLLAWCEAVTCVALDPELAEGTTSVGTDVALQHLAASPVGARVCIRAVVTEATDRRVVLTLDVQDGDTGHRVARGTVVRAVVDVERFLGRLQR